MSRWTKGLLIGFAVLGALMFASCTDSGRPELEDWAAEWQQLTGTIPTLAQLGDPPNRDLCGHALGQIREQQSGLVPTPDLALDAVVQEWFAVAEDAMFECPPSSSQFPDFEYVYQELTRLEAEVEAVLILAADDS